MRQAATAADVSVAVMWWRASLFVLLCSIFTGGVLGQGAISKLLVCLRAGVYPLVPPLYST